MYIRALSPAANKEKDPYAKKREVNYQILVSFCGVVRGTVSKSVLGRFIKA
eukprot:evm.model.NODE_35269_length_3276_cov_11.521062.1